MCVCRSPPTEKIHARRCRAMLAQTGIDRRDIGSGAHSHMHWPPHISIHAESGGVTVRADSTCTCSPARANTKNPARRSHRHTEGPRPFRSQKSCTLQSGFYLKRQGIEIHCVHPARFSTHICERILYVCGVHRHTSTTGTGTAWPMPPQQPYRPRPEGGACHKPSSKLPN